MAPEMASPAERVMFKSLLIGVCLLAGLAACASAPQNNSRTANTATCTTGSRISLNSGPCRSYSNQDLEQTGKTDVAEGLWMLDPDVTLHH
jgi:hypothetical protein